MLHILSDKKRRYFYQQHLQTVRPVLFEAETNGQSMHGFTDNYIKIETTYDPLLVNEIHPVLLENINSENLMEVELMLQHTFLTISKYYDQINQNFKSNFCHW